MQGSGTEETLPHGGSLRSGPSRGEALPSGALVGRYVVLGRLGAGGMGVVYTAHDPELDRKVALKLVRHDFGAGSGAEEAKSRLLREAQALAKLAHPNIVAIHDAGTHDGLVWIAMEYVTGRTLKEWCASEPRSWNEVLEVGFSAGRGIVAAHAAGLLHRDLKPDNIMIDDDGRVRVMDFGLARAYDERTNEPDPAAPPRHEVVSLLTQVGGIVGTPGYMSPEQLACTPLGPASDQFSFCATLWEMLHRRRAFVGTTLMEISTSVLEGRIAAPPAEARVPRWLRQTLERGLRVDGAERWPSMEALLGALLRGRARHGRRKRVAVVGALMTVPLGLLAGREISERRALAACRAERDATAVAWHERTSGARRALAEGDTAGAAQTLAKLDRLVEGHAQAWGAARFEACVAANVDHSLSPKLLRQAQGCFDVELARVEGILERLPKSGSQALSAGISAIARLTPPARCVDPAELQRRLWPADDVWDEVVALRRRLAGLAGARAAGDYAAALREAEVVLDEAIASGWMPVVAEARHEYAMVLAKTGDLEGAERALKQAYFDAGSAGADAIAAAAASLLVYVVGYLKAERAEGLEWSRHAQMAMLRSGGRGGLDDASIANNTATVHFAAGEAGEAEPLQVRAAALFEEQLGPSHPLLATTLNNLAMTRYARGAYEEAEELYRRALSIRTETLGPTHRECGDSFLNLAVLLRTMGKTAESREALEQARSIYEAALGPQHPDIAMVLMLLGDDALTLGDVERARVLQTRALTIREQVLGTEHPDVATSLTHLAHVEAAAGRLEEAQTIYERAVTIREKAQSLEHVDLAATLMGLGAVLARRGEAERASMLFERVLSIQEKAAGADNPELAKVLGHLFELARERNDATAAQRYLDRAQDLCRAVPPHWPTCDWIP